jgi:long-chain acyl-CoA synthetase
MSNFPSFYQITNRERADLERTVDYSAIQSLPEVWAMTSQKFAQIVALKDPHSKPEVALTYSQTYQYILQFATALQSLGLQSGDRVALFADNSPRWLIADQGIIFAGGVGAVRSSQAETEELLYILTNSGSTILIIEDLKSWQKLRHRLTDLPMKSVILISDEDPGQDQPLPIRNFSSAIALGTPAAFKPVPQNRQTLATLLYTSGTTGQPKGVMLSHGNIIHQIETIGVLIQPQPGDLVLSILPTWHSFGRMADYYLLSQGCTQIYTNIRHIKRDFKTFHPQYMVGVPRLWETIYEGAQKQFREQPANKQKLVNNCFALSQRYISAHRIWQNLRLGTQPPTVTEKLLAGIQALLLFPLHTLADRLVYQKVRAATGSNLKYVICGRGSLATHLENFFEIIGLEVLVGYGLTETAPVLSARRYWFNLRGSSGKPLPGTEFKIVDPETRQPLKYGQRGLVLARGPQIMQGYYQNPTATAKAIDPEGWFDTGDLGWLTPEQDIVLTGRSKDTIVLTNGENIEPQPIEDACLRSPYISQIVLVGQDQKSLGALIVPDLEALSQWAVSQNYYLQLPESLQPPQELAENLPPLDLESKIIQDLFRQELNREVKNRPGYRLDDNIPLFRLILEPFSIENGSMTQTLKIRRPVVMERYRDMIDGMFSK